MKADPISVVLRRSDGVDEIRGRDFPDFAEAAWSAIRLADRVSKGEEGIGLGETSSIVIMVAHRVELVIRATAGVPLWKVS